MMMMIMMMNDYCVGKSQSHQSGTTRNSQGKQRWKRWVFRRLQKVDRDSADVKLIIYRVYHGVSRCVNNGTCYRPRSSGDNTFGSIRVCVRPFVRLLWALSCLNRLTYDLDFWHEGQGRRSRSNGENCLRSPFEPVVQSRLILGLGLLSSANGNCEWPLPVHWNCLSERVIRGRSTCRA